ncbi:PH domain-containing protein [Winogradskyella immobilis]|uniref:PH domain-containing protein n=1 Tax=Winogradskyella immobilis TaxID=2816852 RepID=A0ABS8EST4_9FLAO|nr:PH domain-containing protein [Winogradskyella immobilis]MCC1485352.1 PH domain-containing protein [Winogradskyella immobilis]MCG0017444.1 PH domain-containing protein [Winogradskyella immobilis]
MTAFNFETPSRQSAKGIIVNLGVSTYRFIRGTIIIIGAFFIQYIRSDKVYDFTTPKVIIPAIGFIVFMIVLSILRYRNFKFHVTTEHFVLKQGVFNKEEISVAKSKIQNVLIKQNVLQQIINVVSLAIETAGDEKTEIEITALPREKANALKETLLSHQNIERQEIEIETEVFFKASTKLLVLEGITENHLKSFVVIFAFIVGTYRDLKDFIENLNISNQIKSNFNLDDESLMSLLLFNVSIVIVILILAFLYSLTKTVIQNFNLVVKQKKDDLEISKGLFNKINIGLIASRLQTTTLTTNRFKRALGLYQLKFTQAMMNKKQQLKFNIIGLNKIKVDELLERFYPKALPLVENHKPNSYIIYRVIIISLIPLLIINGFLIFAPPYLYLINVPIVALLAYNTYFTYKKLYYSIDDKYVVVGGGALINTTTSFLEISKIQAVTLTQSIFQRRRGLATVEMHSASKDLNIPHIDMTTALNIKNYLLYKIESEDKDWM